MFTVWTMFLLGTFLIIVVFLNMLIAIMSDTFARVQAIKEENTLKEQATLINDHIWLVDLEAVFKGQRYVAVMTPDISITQQATDPADDVEDMGAFIIKKLDASFKTNQNRQKIIEKNQKQTHKQHLATLVKCKQMLDGQLQAAKQQRVVNDEEMI